MAGQLYVGTSGFQFAEWKGSFYPEKIKAADMLACYARQLSSVEINMTFRRFPRENVLQTWLRQVDGNRFVFTLKAHQRITHKKKLEDVGREVEDFARIGGTLSDRLGTILFQCPPYLRYDRAVLEAFLAVLPADVRCALEFRHRSFDTDEVRGLLAERGAAWVVNDTGTPESKVLHRTAPFVYVRMRDEEIGDAGLREWAEKVRGVLPVADAYVYFKHEGLGGVEARRFLEIMEVLN